MTNSNASLTQDDISELIGIAQFLRNIPSTEGHAYSRILAEITKKLHSAVSAPNAEQVDAKPFGYFHELLNHEGKGEGVWLGCPERSVLEQSAIEGETGKEIIALYTALPVPVATSNAGSESVRGAASRVPSHIESLLQSVADALQACSRWHKGEEYRDSEDVAEHEVWEAHKHLIDNAIGALAEVCVAERSQGAMLRYALHSLSKIASGIDLPSKYAALAIKHITCGTYEKDNVPIEGQEISIDVSTGDADAQNRIFATLTGETVGDVWLAEELSRNFYPSAPNADFNGEVLGRVVTYLSQFEEFQPCGDNSADSSFRNIADCIDKLRVKAERPGQSDCNLVTEADDENIIKTLVSVKKVPNRGFDYRRIRWDAYSKRFVLVVLDHPVYTSQVSEAFVAKNPERFLKADQLAPALPVQLERNLVTLAGAEHMASVMRKVLGDPKASSYRYIVDYVIRVTEIPSMDTKKPGNKE